MSSANEIVLVKAETVKDEIFLPEFVSVNQIYPIKNEEETEKNDNQLDNYVHNDIISICDSDSTNDQDDNSNDSDCSDNELMLNIINNACTIIETTAVVEENSVLSPEKNDDLSSATVVDDSGVISAETDNSGLTPVVNDTSNSGLSQESKSTDIVDKDDVCSMESVEFESEIYSRVFQGDIEKIVNDSSVDPATINTCFVCNKYSENFNHEFSSKKLCDLCYRHLSTAGVSEEPLRCKSCNAKFTKKFYYDGHICHNNHAVNRYGDRFGFTCKLCKRYCYEFKDYITHIKYKHDSANCQFCKRIFHENSHLYIHIKLCHANEDKPHKCRICGKSFIYKRNFNDHYKLHVSGFAYKCQYCERPFRSKGVMKNHLRSHWKN